MNLTYVIITLACLHGLNIMHDAQLIAGFYIYAYVKNLERSLKHEQDMNKFLDRYNKITDCQDKFQPLCDYIVSFFFNILDSINM